MAERPSAYVQKQPGDIIRSGDWNELQVRAREELQGHAHTGGGDGTPIPREGLAPGAVDGSRIDPESVVRIKALTLGGDLRVEGAASLKEITDLQSAVAKLGADKAERAGDSFAGGVSLGGSLSLNDNLLLLRSARDPNNGLGWFGGATAFAGASFDGPALFGYQGGALGTTQGGQAIALSWNTAGNIGIGLAAPSTDFRLDVNGPVRLGGSLTLGSSDVYFSRTDHDHTGIGNQAGWAAIENARSHDALMILGRAGTAHGRTVKLFDYLQVNGQLDVTDVLRAPSGGILGAIGIGTQEYGAVSYPYETIQMNPVHNLRLCFGGTQRFIFQTDGALRIDFNQGYWVFQTDGNLVKFNRSNQVVWALNYVSGKWGWT